MGLCSDFSVGDVKRPEPRQNQKWMEHDVAIIQGLSVLKADDGTNEKDTCSHGFKTGR